MKHFTKIATSTLAAAMIIAITSCGTQPEATEAITEASELRLCGSRSQAISLSGMR